MHKAINIAKSLKADQTRQNFLIGMTLSTLKKMLTKLKEIKGIEKAQ